MSAVALFALSGCAVPPALTVATTVLTTASYLATGKGPGDHLLSLATGRECDTIRAFREKPFSPICRRPARLARATAPALVAPTPLSPGRVSPAPVSSAPPSAAPPATSETELLVAGRALAAVAPAAGGATRAVPRTFPRAPELMTPDRAAPDLPTDVVAGLRAALRRNAETATGAAIAAEIAGDDGDRINAAQARRADAAIAFAVVAAIARHPDAAAPIVSAATAAAPESRNAIVAGARAAFPGFAATIERAAATPAPVAVLARLRGAAPDAILEPGQAPVAPTARARPTPRPRRPLAKATPTAASPPA